MKKNFEIDKVYKKLLMKILGFKKWYENKDRHSPIISSSKIVEKLGPNIYKVPQKMLHIEMDVLTENIDVKKSKDSIARFILNTNPDNYTPEDLKFLKSKVAESKKNGTHLFLLGYDFSSGDPKKCFKNSQKNVQNFKSSFPVLENVPTRGMGAMERINENHNQHFPNNLIKQRVELIECNFDIEFNESKLEIPFYFNPNDYHLLEKYKLPLRGLITKYILLRESFEINVIASKPWPASKRRELNEDNHENENNSTIFEMKYPDPEKSSLFYPQNKPSKTETKVSVIELTEKRSKSVVDYLSGLTSGMPIKYSNSGDGYKDGNPSLIIEVK
jgi:hypothetical protein